MSLRCSFLHFLIIYSAMSVACSASSSSIQNERMALLALRDGFTLGGALPDDSFLNSWNSSLHICDWNGITCGRRHKRVTELNLVEQKLGGVIYPSIGNLSFLRVLDLRNNTLHGEIPRQIGNLHRLEYLYLRGNSLQGQIPVELSNCSNLLHIYISSNKLSGQLPFQLGSLSKLTRFWVDNNHLVGEMPTLFGNISSLIELAVGVNKLHGEIRDSLQGLSKLRLLSLYDNSFTGTVSPVYNLSTLTVLELDTNKFSGTLTRKIDVVLPNLRVLSLYSNSFSGNIPSTLFNISRLAIIYLDSNKFRGRVPDNIGHLKNLKSLDINDNNLGGREKNDMRFIDSLANCTKLEQLTFSGNRFLGPIPKSIGNLSVSDNLWSLSMSYNYIAGVIPEEIGQVPGLTRLYLGNNMLTGTIPDSIGKLSNISILNLSKNKLYGEIPSSLGNLTNLYVLNLSSNSLDGNIPAAFRNSVSMEIIDVASNRLGGYLQDDLFIKWGQLILCRISHNSFHGRFPSLYGNLRGLTELYASYNNFSGQIPAQLGESLVFLSLAGNSFQGNIPTSLGNLKGLQLLDLSSNNLSGPVIKELASLSFLLNLNLSFNRLEGEVPIFGNEIEVSIVGNRKLCGGNPELGLHPCPLKWKRKAISRKVIIVAAVGTATCLSLVVFLFICLFRRRKQRKENISGLAEKYRRITYVELFNATEGFAESNLIGSGSFGDVYKGNLDGYEKKLVAVKVLKLSKYGAMKSFNAECRVLRRIRHRNLLGIITSCSSLDHKGNEFKALVFDLMPCGNLDSWLHIYQDQEAKAPLTLAKRLQIALDVACALNYLHNYCDPPIIHCDLKPSNVLLDDDMVAHVGDFGLAKLLHHATENISEGESLSTAIRGTVGYVAPEYGMGADIAPQGDIYSYSILLLELITGKRPTNEMFNNEMNIRSYVERALPDHIEEVIDECLLNELHEAVATQTNPEQYKLRWHASLSSFLEVGISCSAESSKDRMGITSVIKCLTSIKEKGGIIS